ncbi:MAG TPA: ankyrin repeat domain-containing protein, partial [Spirochaetes bacterium]|nr:ankyrin repeat domain-containing protein [Spirochaetota bacterium]
MVVKQKNLERKKLVKDLFTAIANGNKNKLIKLIKKGADVNSRYPYPFSRETYQFTPLHFLACYDDGDEEEIAKILLKHGANINAGVPPVGRTPLHIAVVFNNIKMIKSFIKNSANVNAKT